LFTGITLVWVFLPFIPLLLWAFTQKWFYPDPYPQEFGLRAWRYLFFSAGGRLLPALLRSVLLSGTVSVLSVFFGTLAGRALGLTEFRGKTVVAVLLAAPVIAPPLCTAMGLHLWFLIAGLTETMFGVILIHMTACLPYAAYVMWGVFSHYNPAFEEQARTLGAGPFSVAVRVTLPMILPGVAVAGMFSFLVSWSQYISTLIIGGGRVVTLPVLLFALVGGGDRPVAAAVALVLVVPAFGALIAGARIAGERILAGVW
jgi:putative spermidine/putrescine transport system permease protein